MTSTIANTNPNTTEQDKNLHINTAASPTKSPKPLIQSLSSNTNTSTTSVTSTIGSTQPLNLNHTSSSESSGTNITTGLDFASPKNLSTTSLSANPPTNTNTESGTTPSGHESSNQKQFKATSPTHDDQKDLDERQQILQESKTNLVINYIPADMNEGTLGTLFSPYGTMLNIKIVVDPHTGRSRGYGFVKYESEESAARAQEALNGFVIGNKKLKVAYSRPQSKEIQNSNLYVTNVPLDWKNQQLGEVFKPFGYVVESRILLDQDGKSRGAGFVRMDSHANALKAIAGSQGVSGLVVKLAQKKNQNRRWGGNSPGENHNMDQGNDYDNRAFNHRGHGRRSGGIVNNQGGDHNRHMFQGQMPGGNYGKRNSSDRRQFYRPRGGSMGDPSSHDEGFYHPSQYSFVQQPMAGVEPYYGQGMSSNVMRESGPGSSGRSIQTNPRGYSPQSYNIVVRNLPEHYNVDHLIKLYAPYGPIQSVHIQKPSRHSNGKPQMSYGIVSFFFADDAKNAIEQTDRRQEGNRILHVTWQ